MIEVGHVVSQCDVRKAINDTGAISRRQVGRKVAGCIAYYAELATAFDHC